MKQGLDGVFHALSDPTRRSILARLTAGEHSNGVLAKELPLSRPTISKHLGVLCDTGLVSRRKQGRNWFYRLEVEPLAEAHQWLGRIRAFLAIGLEELEDAPGGAAMSNEADLRVEQEIMIRASIERVFKAFTDPLELATWWRIPGYYETEHADVDLRVGGRYRLTGSSAGLNTFEVHGEYLAVEPPSVLRYTWNPSWDQDAYDSVVDIRLESVDDETRVKVVHTAFSTPNARDEHDQGWPAVLQAVAQHCAVA